MLIAGDLGRLIGRCAWVVVRHSDRVVLLQSKLLIQWRVLQVVTATPYVPCPHSLMQLFPQTEIRAHCFQVPTRSCPPEAVLAECLIQGIPVAESRIIYRAPG